MMRSTMLAAIAVFLGGSMAALADPSAIGNETPNASQAQEKPVTDTTEGASEPEPFKVPAGYQAKKRGKKMVYCKKSMESGTRFSQEKCYSEDQLRAMELAREENQSKIDQARRICASPEACASN